MHASRSKGGRLNDLLGTERYMTRDMVGLGMLLRMTLRYSVGNRLRGLRMMEEVLLLLILTTNPMMLMSVSLRIWKVRLFLLGIFFGTFFLILHLVVVHSIIPFLVRQAPVRRLWR